MCSSTRRTARRRSRATTSEDRDGVSGRFAVSQRECASPVNTRFSAMTRAYHPLRRALALAAALLLGVLVVGSADAATSAVARFGSHGAATLRSGTTNSVTISVKGLTNGTWA